MEHENQVSVVTRVYRKAEGNVLSEKDLKSLEGKVTDLQNLARALETSSGIVVASTKDLPESGRKVLEASGYKIVYADTTAGDPSNSSLLNTAMESLAAGTDRVLVVSLSLVHNEGGVEKKKSEIAARQIAVLDSLFKYWERKPGRKLAMAGSLILGEQNLDLIQEAISPDGKRNIDLDNLGVAFPNFSLSMIRNDIRIAEDTDNGKLGKVWFKNEQKEEIIRVGGNEDFYAGFKHMLKGEDVALLIDPYMPGERHDKVIIEDAKYRRRLDVFKIYAAEIIIEALNQAKIPELATKDLSLDYIEKIVEETIDQHLFYIKINSEGNPEILLTRRQLSKKMESPVSS